MPPVMTHRSVPAWPAITLMVVRTGLWRIITIR
jgi:hypothetical protein